MNDLLNADNIATVLTAVGGAAVPVLGYLGLKFTSKQSTKASTQSNEAEQQKIAFEAYEKVTTRQDAQIEQLGRTLQSVEVRAAATEGRAAALEVRVESLEAALTASRGETERERKLKLSAFAWIRNAISAFHIIAGGSAQLPPLPSDIASDI